MQASSRIIINTASQYLRTIINLLLSLYSVRIIMSALGVDDYGIYSLVAGVVSMLSFLTNSLIGSTQRFLSFHQGKGCIEKLKEVFSNSLILHIGVGFIIFIILESLVPILFDGYLDISHNRINAAKSVYQLVIIMVYISFIAAPYRALLISRENIVYTSLVDVFDGIFKVVFAIFLTYTSYDRLIVYGWIMLGIQLFNLFAFAIYTHHHYKECIFPHIQHFKLQYIKDLSRYTSWLVYSSACIAIRTQGLAIVLNKKLGIAINAAYGVGSQISGVVSFVGASIGNAISPQLIAAEGCGNRKRMWLLANIESKLSFLLMAMVGIPTIFEMQSLLTLWLIEVPPYATQFGSMFIAMQIVDMLTSGLALANRAIGNIGKYILITCTPKLLVLPLSILMLNYKMPIYTVCIVMVFVELFCMLLRIIPLIKENDFDTWRFVREVIFRSLPPVLAILSLCYTITIFIDFRFRFIVTYIISIPIFLLVSYTCSLSEMERNKIKEIVMSIIRHKSHNNI